MSLPESNADSTSREARLRTALWGGPFVIGLLLTLLGVLALGSVVLTSLVSVFFYGALLVVGGVFEIVHSFRLRNTGPFLMFLLGGILSVLVGLMVLTRPGVGLLALTLLLSGYFFASGLFRGITAGMERHAGWVWDCAYGVVSVVLGAIIFSQLPGASLYVLGIVVGVEILARGLALMAAAFTVRGAVRRFGD